MKRWRTDLAVPYVQHDKMAYRRDAARCVRSTFVRQGLRMCLKNPTAISDVGTRRASSAHNPNHNFLVAIGLRPSRIFVPAPITMGEGWGRSFFALVMLALVSMACWSSDTLFIPPTATTVPTDIPPTPSFSSKYTLGEEVTVVTAGIAPLYITKSPEPPSRSNRVPNAACYADSVVVIEGIQQVDGITYYQITCNNRPGWVSEELLSGG